ncbi:MAG: hypothetical protein RLY93_21030 [Sumerlaeia bacterium]
MTSRHPLPIFVALALGCAVSAAAQIGTEFTYQGYLEDGGTPVETAVDLRFTLKDATDATIGSPITVNNETYPGGLVNEDLDFGDVFHGDPRFLQVEVADPSGGPFVALTPDTEVQPVPYAMYATEAGMLTSEGTVITDLPTTITVPGAYFITQDLTGQSGFDGIVIDTDNVTLNLNGYTLVGVAGSDDGINILTGYTSIRIFNGTLTSWGDDGVDADGTAGGIILVDIHSFSNGDCGFDGSTEMTLIRCQAIDNSGDGFFSFVDSQFVDCIADSNGDDGFDDVGSSSLERCIATDNDEDGFVDVRDSSLRGCVADGNTFSGFYDFEACTLENCTASFNDENGFDNFVDCAIRGCVSTSNFVWGYLAITHSILESVTAGNNGSGGFSVTTCTINACTATFNGGPGFSGLAMTLNNCSALDNGSDGLISLYSVITNFSSSNNEGAGLNVISSKIHNSIATGNVGFGYQLTGSSAFECLAADNDFGGFSLSNSEANQCKSSSNGRIQTDFNEAFEDHGFLLQNGAIVRNCTALDHDHGSGFVDNGGSPLIEGCFAYNNSGSGFSADSGAIVIGNRARDNGTDFLISLGATLGEILDFSTGGIITSGNPHANIRY